MPKQWLPTVCIDFDGVVHGYSKGWQDGSIYDDPVPGVGAGLLRLMAGCRVAIYSSRSKSLPQRWRMKRYLGKIIEDACFKETELADAAWAKQVGKPADWRPWTAGDVMDQAREIASAIRYPLFKPAAWLTIDDRAICFTGDWTDPALTADALRQFKPWNARAEG